MRYKTIVLELLQQHPEIYDDLRSSRRLQPTLELLATQLKARHEAWQGCLSRTNRGGSPSQTASAALELALKELEDCLTSRSPSGENEPLSLDAAMAFIRGRTPPA